MGGLGSGNRHRFDKKITTGECNCLDVRSLYHDGLLKPGTCFSSSWSSRAGRETGSMGGFVSRNRVLSRIYKGTNAYLRSLLARVELPGGEVFPQLLASGLELVDPIH